MVVYGGSSLKKPTSQGFGTDMIGRIIKQQAKGEMRLDWDKAGLGCQILLPINTLVQDTSALPL